MGRGKNKERTPEKEELKLIWSPSIVARIYESATPDAVLKDPFHPKTSKKPVDRKKKDSKEEVENQS